MESKLIRTITSTLFTVLTLSVASAHAGNVDDQSLRIQTLVPDSWIELPAIEPAIPSHFVAGEWSEFDRVLWGTQEDVAIFNGIEAPIKSELISLRHSSDTVQIGPNEFSGERQLAQTLRQMGLKHVRVQKLRWGPYPVLALEAVAPNGRILRNAWVGLNSENGWTIFFEHFAPQHDERCCRVWNNFLHNTVALGEYDTIRLHGQTLKDGYTIYKAATAKLRVTAERRRSDQLLAVMIEPLTPNTSYRANDIAQGQIGLQWKYGAPCTKIYGVTTEQDGKYGTSIVDGVITVLTKDVDTFSFDVDPSHHAQDVLIYSSKTL